MTAAVRDPDTGTGAPLGGGFWAGAPLLVGLVFWIVLPLACVASLVVGSMNLATKIDRKPTGTLGTYLVTSHNCREELCITGGTFTSSDGSLVQTDLFGSYSWQLGTTHDAIYNSDAADVIPLPGRWDPTATILGMLGAIGFLAAWGWCLRRARRRGRDERAARTTEQ
jgi:hypothetical protein